MHHLVDSLSVDGCTQDSSGVPVQGELIMHCWNYAGSTDEDHGHLWCLVDYGSFSGGACS